MLVSTSYAVGPRLCRFVYCSASLEVSFGYLKRAAPSIRLKLRVFFCCDHNGVCVTDEQPDFAPSLSSGPNYISLRLTREASRL